MADRLFLKAVRPDLRTRNGYRWAFPGDGDTVDGVCRLDHVAPNCLNSGCVPGLWVAKTLYGASQGGHGLATLLLVAVPESSVIAEDGHKARIDSYTTLDVVDGWRLIRQHGHNANLESADLQGAKLQGAKLQGAKLQGAKLQGADLQDAHLRGANLWGANLQDARANNYTMWPDGFDPDKAGVLS